MKLSSLVQYLNHLDTLSVRDGAAAATAEVDKITQVVQQSQIQIADVSRTLTALQSDLDTCLSAYQSVLDQLRQSVQHKIVQEESEYFAESTARYHQGIRLDTPDHILNRKIHLGHESEITIQDRLNTFCSWQYPCMVIRPAHSPGMKNLVAFDPLYLVDTHVDLFAPVRTMFTAEYQRRLRYYVIEEYTDRGIFWNLPHSQFGLICAFRYFEYKPWEILQQYLTDIFELLRPGGSVLFSFNDCDQWRAVGAVEHFSGCYTPGRLVSAHVQQMGYEIVSRNCLDSGNCWMELRRPGSLDSLRGGQVLAGIYRKSAIKPQVIEPETEPETLDNSVQDLYNQLDLERLIELAGILNVDISADKTKREFNIKKVRKTISAYLERMNYPEATLRQLFNPKEPK
jgi:SAM-dependent methyltransferase